MARKKQEIGLQNRLEIVIQSLLDYEEEGGRTAFGIAEGDGQLVIGQLVIELAGVVEENGRFMVVDSPALIV